MAHAVDIRKVYSFLKSKGLDPAEFSRTNGRVILKRKQKAKIERLLSDSKRVIIYFARAKLVIRDADAKFLLVIKNKRDEPHEDNS